MDLVETSEKCEMLRRVHPEVSRRTRHDDLRVWQAACQLSHLEDVLQRELSS